MALLTPGFLLAGLLLAAIPLVIHWLNRRRFKQQPWAAMSFLLAAMKKNRRRLRFEQWLLLAVRCLLLALLGLALARPVGCGDSALSGLTRSSGLHVLILDDSYSMAYAGTAEGTTAGLGGPVPANGTASGPPARTGLTASPATHFERQRTLARAIIAELVSGSDAVAVVAAGRPARVVVPITYDLEAAATAIEQLELRFVPTDLPGGLLLATELAGGGAAGALRPQTDAAAAAGRVARGQAVVRVLRVISDGTRSSLIPPALSPTEGATPGASPPSELLRAVESAAATFDRLVYHHLGDAEQASAAVLSIGLGGAAGNLTSANPGLAAAAFDLHSARAPTAAAAVGTPEPPSAPGSPVVGVEAGAVVTLRGPGAPSLLAEVARFGTQLGRGAAVPGRSVQWRVDDVVLPVVSPPLEASEGVQTVLVPETRFPGPGWRVVEAQLTGTDALATHGSRWRVVEVVDRVRVLLVEGERGTGPMGSSGAFLRLALSPVFSARSGPGEATPVSPLDVDTVGDLELGSRPLADYRVILLAGVTELGEAQADALRAFVESGGVLILFAGEGMSLPAYNRVLLPRGLLPGQLVRRVTAADGRAFRFDFDPRGNVHPMLAVLRGEERSGLDAAEVFVYVQVASPPPGPLGRESAAGDPSLDADASLNAPAAAATTNVPPPQVLPERVLGFRQTDRGADTPGMPAEPDPAITTHRLGGGRVVFIATSAGADGWNTLPARPVYVTLVQELVGRSLRPRDAFLNRLVGERLRLVTGSPVPPGQPPLRLSGPPTLTNPAGQVIPLELRPATQDPPQPTTALESASEVGAAVWVSPPLTRPGVYRLGGIVAAGEGGEIGTLPVAVNVDAVAEADVRTLTREAIRSTLVPATVPAGWSERVEVIGDEPPQATERPAGQNADFGWAVLLVLLLFVLFEGLLAWRFGHQRASAA